MGTGALSTVHTDSTYNQSDRAQLGHCLLYIQKALGREDTKKTRQTGALTVGHTGALPTNQSNRGPLGHCLLYLQRAQTTSQTGGTQWGTQLYIQKAQTTSQNQSDNLI